MKEIISPVTSFLQARKTPFFTTYIYVWIIRNWVFLINLIFTNEVCYADHWIFLIDQQFPSFDLFIEGVIKNIGITLVVIICTYLVLIISRGITNLYQFTVLPFVLQFVSRGELMLKTEATNLLKDYKIVSDSLEREKKIRRERDDEVTHLNSKVSELVKTTQSYESNKASLEKKNIEVEFYHYFLQMGISFPDSTIKESINDEKYLEFILLILQQRKFNMLFELHKSYSENKKIQSTAMIGPNEYIQDDWDKFIDEVLLKYNMLMKIDHDKNGNPIYEINNFLKGVVMKFGELKSTL